MKNFTGINYLHYEKYDKIMNSRRIDAKKLNYNVLSIKSYEFVLICKMISEI